MAKKTNGVEVVEIEIKELYPSNTNPRKTFDENELKDLAESIKDKGILSPITVRDRVIGANGALGSRAGVCDGYEIVCGERRFRAAKLAGLTTVPCIVRELSNQQVIEIQVIENMQRSDLSPLEEARGYQVLHEKHKYSWDDLALKIGKSKNYIYTRLRLLNLPKKIQDAIIADKFKLSWAEQLLRVPDEEKLIEIYDDLDGYNDFDDLKQMVEETLLDLKTAPFNTKKTNDKGIGACVDCTQRTGSQPDLFGNFKKHDYCQDKKCWDAKKAAHEKAIIEAYKSEGKSVVVGEKAKKLIESVRYSGSMAEIDEKCTEVNGKATYRQAIKGTDYEPIAAIDEAGKLHLLVERAKFKKTIPESKRKYNYGESPEEKAKKEKERLKEQAIERAFELSLKLIADKAKKLDFNKLDVLKLISEAYDEKEMFNDLNAKFYKAIFGEDSESDMLTDYIDHATEKDIKALLVLDLVAGRWNTSVTDSDGLTDFGKSIYGFLGIEQDFKDLLAYELKQGKKSKATDSEKPEGPEGTDEPEEEDEDSEEPAPAKKRGGKK